RGGPPRRRPDRRLRRLLPRGARSALGRCAGAAPPREQWIFRRLRLGLAAALRLGPRPRSLGGRVWPCPARRSSDRVERSPVIAERYPRLLLFLIGQNLILLSYVLIRRMTASLYDLETSALLTSIAYFAGISLGYLRPERIPPRLVRALFPVFL